MPAHKREAACDLYAKIVTQARHPDFYRVYAVPDSIDGRFDMVVLHVFLVLARLRKADDVCTDLQMMLQEALFADLDRSLREMGVGDMSVGKHVKNMASAYFGRLKAYGDALESDDDKALSRALTRNVWRQEDGFRDENAVRLAAYVRRQTVHLAEQDTDGLCTGTIDFLEPCISESE